MEKTPVILPLSLFVMQLKEIHSTVLKSIMLMLMIKKPNITCLNPKCKTFSVHTLSSTLSGTEVPQRI